MSTGGRVASQGCLLAACKKLVGSIVAEVLGRGCMNKGEYSLHLKYQPLCPSLALARALTHAEAPG